MLLLSIVERKVTKPLAELEISFTNVMDIHEM